jgi:MarR family transcriptional repressor of emrRAB
MMDEGLGRVREAVPALPVPEAGMARLLLLVGGALQAELEAKLKPHRLNDSEFLALMILFSSPDGSSTPGELCEYTSQGATNMTRIANALVQRKLITRGASKQDRRRVVLHITAEGRRFVRKMLPTLFPRLGLFFAGFSRAELDSFDRLLRKLADNIDHMNADAQP